MEAPLLVQEAGLVPPVQMHQIIVKLSPFDLMLIVIFLTSFRQTNMVIQKLICQKNIVGHIYVTNLQQKLQIDIFKFTLTLVKL